MKIIEKAFEEATSKKPMPKAPKPKWWGGYNDGTYYIMRYHHTMVVFNKSEVKVITNDTITDKAGVKNALELIKAWQKDKE
jgi:hypothetical protein